MTELVRFPHTPHLAWLGPGRPRADKVLSPAEARELLAGDVVVEEKVDGANLGFSLDERGGLRAQSRGSYLDPAERRGQWKALDRWLAPYRDALVDALLPDLILFGEWCYAVHSVRYTRLPDWFLTFDVYDRVRGAFWSAHRRDELARTVGVQVVPRLGAGRLDLRGVEALLGDSQLTDGPAEGVYVRREANGWLQSRAKLVRPEFIQAIEEHWSKRPLEVNRVAPPRRAGS